MRIYKVLRHDEYRALISAGRSSGAPVDLADGYIHLSTGAQLDETLARHFAGETGLMLLELESDALAPLKWEPSRGGALFPHLYRELRKDDVLRETALKPGPDGRMIGEFSWD
ncbi:DUF952 domain-containing protein [Paracoccus sp. DMF-8]|uniref:DUF952 domain-containing protein n=1 Tax=Paracoccus sp. DMF-8 TaxID=3019445 RepID=UPI0023E7E604|nr:DUF952 domain-containing protein [Paracoccus sp. DMF-8]MDF3605683.1 DUF952 domain-containing protein [Paracoccus sp. DMF-8]